MTRHRLGDGCPAAPPTSPPCSTGSRSLAVAACVAVRRHHGRAPAARLAGQPGRRRQHRAAGARAEHPVHALPGRRARHQRVPDRRARAAGPAPGVRRRHRPGEPLDHRRRRGTVGRPGRARRPEHDREQVLHLGRARPRQQPAGLPGRCGVPADRRRPAPRRGRTDHHRSRRCQRPAVRGRDGRPAAVAAPAARPGGVRACCSGSTGSSPHASGAGSTSASSPPPPRSRSSPWSRSWSARASAAPTRTCSTAATRTPSTRRPPAPPATTPRPTRACA